MLQYSMSRIKQKRISELCLEYSFGEHINQEINSSVLKVYRFIKDPSLFKELKIVDLVPTYTTLAIHFEIDSPLYDDEKVLENLFTDVLTHDIKTDPKQHQINVSYNGADIEYLSKTLHLTKEEIVKIHTKKIYTIAMLGFRPYFPYLLGLDTRLQTPRRANPRVSVPKGSVAIASNQTGIYPETSPGGWHILGSTDFENYSDLTAGDTIVFKEIHNAT